MGKTLEKLWCMGLSFGGKLWFMGVSLWHTFLLLDADLVYCWCVYSMNLPKFARKFLVICSKISRHNCKFSRYASPFWKFSQLLTGEKKIPVPGLDRTHYTLHTHMYKRGFQNVFPHRVSTKWQHNANGEAHTCSSQ